MLYAIYYFHSRLSLSHTTGSLVYFGYSFIMSYACFILTGRKARDAHLQLGGHDPLSSRRCPFQLGIGVLKLATLSHKGLILYVTPPLILWRDSKHE